MKLKIRLISLLLISTPFVAHGVTYYKSVDKNGNIQYTQTKPREAEAERIKVNAHAPDNSSTYKRPSLGSAKKESSKKPDKAEEEKTPEKKLSKEEIKKGCAAARAKLATLNATARSRQRNEKGEVSYMSDAQKKASVKKVQALIKKHCK